LVVLVLLTIFAGILFLLIRMERKLSKMEKTSKIHK
ncbi:MAG TPA: CcmD family protein, partial [Chitinophagaceae bacterium]|nr:CcmD family protein [Chitinophagaceae bacterium]